MTFQIECCFGSNGYQITTIDAIDGYYATKIAKIMFPDATKINIKQI